MLLYSLVPFRRHVPIVTTQGIERVTVQLKDTPTKVYAIGAGFILSKVDVGRAAPFASPIRFESLGLLHDPYTLPAGNPIDP